LDALIFGAVLYSLTSLGGFYGSFVALGIMFGCISQAINQVSVGRLKRSFMPDFSDFAILDDVVQPAILSLGILIVSWGPAIVLVLALVFGVINAGSAPGGLSLLTTAPSQSETTLTPDDIKILSNPNSDPAKLEAANRKLNQVRHESQIAREAARAEKEQTDTEAMIRQFIPYLGAGILLIVFLVFLFWGIVYSPMALAIAGYTQSFTAVINPLVGLDTIRRMRFTYFKAFVMVLVLGFSSLLLQGIVSRVTAPLALPLSGNLLASFISGCIAFYFNLVIACVLGLSLYKCADRLGISVD
jgi:hypothetical protein